jgi:anthranilate synthase component 2
MPQQRPGGAVGGRHNGVLISNGPGQPDTVTETIALIQALAGKLPMMGICLGHQAIAEAFGGELEQCESPIHGKSSLVKQINDDPLFKGIPIEFQVGRYHSWRNLAEEFQE